MNLRNIETSLASLHVPITPHWPFHYRSINHGLRKGVGALKNCFFVQYHSLLFIVELTRRRGVQHWLIQLLKWSSNHYFSTLNFKIIQLPTRGNSYPSPPWKQIPPEDSKLDEKLSGQFHARTFPWIPHPAWSLVCLPDCHTYCHVHIFVRINFLELIRRVASASFRHPL